MNKFIKKFLKQQPTDPFMDHFNKQNGKFHLAVAIVLAMPKLERLPCRGAGDTMVMSQLLELSGCKDRAYDFINNPCR
tara:strand:+ start:1709 stop:1942 length:234 start_codon:yes stop_codon:yes gene_type:complete